MSITTRVRCSSTPSADTLVNGVCDDPARVDYLRQYLSVASDAVAEAERL